jgi:hypothetical protein
MCSSRKADKPHLRAGGSRATSACTALQALRGPGEIQPGQRVLINGASGGVGLFAVQIAKSFGADVTGVFSTTKMHTVHSIGTDDVIDSGGLSDDEFVRIAEENVEAVNTATRNLPGAHVHACVLRRRRGSAHARHRTAQSLRRAAACATASHLSRGRERPSCPRVAGLARRETAGRRSGGAWCDRFHDQFPGASGDRRRAHPALTDRRNRLQELATGGEPFIMIQDVIACVALIWRQLVRRTQSQPARVDALQPRSTASSAGVLVVIGFPFPVCVFEAISLHTRRPPEKGKGIAQKPNTVTRLRSPKEEIRPMPASLTVSTQIP